MKYLLIILLFLISTTSIYSQGNYSDSTYILNYQQSINYYKNNELFKYKVGNLEHQLELLHKIIDKQNAINEELTKRDSLYKIEIDNYKIMEESFYERNNHTTDIINTYKLGNTISENNIKSVQQQLKKQKFVTGVYKVGTISLAALLVYVIIKP